MSLGVGLGAFMDGFERGSAARERMDNRKLQKSNRDALTKVETDGQAAFDADVASGKEDGKNYDRFWKEYVLPKRKAELLRQGDVAGARQLEDWGNSDAALQGGKLFSSAMLKAQTGDAGGALADVIKAGQVKGYIEHGYELVGQEDIVDSGGNQIGYRLRVKDQDGKELQQDIAVGDVPRMIATFANPDSAWQSQVERRAAEDRTKSEIDLYERKKKIDRENPAPEDRAEIYRKAREARMKNDLDFADMSAEEQDAALRKDLEAADTYAGTSAAPSAAAPSPRRTLVDRNTGRPVNPDPDPNVGLGGSASPAAAAQAPGLGAAPAPTPPDRPSARAAPTREKYVADAIADAADHMVNGGNPEMISQRLLHAGIPPEQWPANLQQEYRKRQEAPGLGQ